MSFLLNRCTEINCHGKSCSLELLWNLLETHSRSEHCNHMQKFFGYEEVSLSLNSKTWDSYKAVLGSCARRFKILLSQLPVLLLRQLRVW